MKRYFIFLLLILSSPFYITAAEYTDSVYASKFCFGVFFDYQYNLHYADFRALPGVPNCCPKFENGSGGGFSIGLLFEKYILNFLGLGARAGFESLGGLLSSNENFTLLVNSQPVAGVFRHDIQTNIYLVDFEPFIDFHPFHNFNIFSGFSFNYTTGATFEQSEHIVSPDNGSFENGQRIRNQVSGNIADISSLRLAYFGAVSYDIPLNDRKNIFISPEAGYWIGLNNMVKDLEWKISSFKFGMSVKYLPLISKKIEVKEIFKKIEKTDTVNIVSNKVKSITYKYGRQEYDKNTIITGNVKTTTDIISRTDTLFYPQKSNLSCKIEAVAVIDDTTEEPLDKIKVEEFLSTRMIPLLNYVFFDNNSSSIPARYINLNKTEYTNFELQPLFNETAVSAYLRILNIVGKRLTEYPDANLAVTGCNSDEGEEKGDIDLSFARASAVADYLTNVWGIDAARIDIKSRNLPDKPSSVGKDDGIAENRRVEIKSDFQEILSPLILSDTLHQVSPPVIGFRPVLNGQNISGEWKITIKHNDMIIKEFSGKGKVPAIIDWRIADDRKRLRSISDPLSYTFELKDSVGDYCRDDYKINVDSKTIRKKRELKSEDKRIDQYSLILFNFDQRTLDKDKLNTIDYIKENISDSSIVKIEGFTDRIGEKDYNYQLSVDRAKSVGKAIGIGNITTKGYGNSILLYNNTLPEGRFYCRTVNVSVETPIESK